MGPVAVITGGSRGIGAAIAKAYAQAGYRLVLIARRIHQDATDSPFKAAYAGDVCDPAFLTHVAHLTEKRFHRVDVLVNAAGQVGPVGPFAENDPGEWIRTLHTNLVGTYTAMRAFLPLMVATNAGTIINFAGGGAFGNRENFSAYSVSKAAVVRLTDAAAMELKRYGITVNAISPGQINTKLFDEMMAAGPDRVGESGWSEFQQRKRTGGDSMTAVTDLALWLASPQARALTGRVISAKWDPWRTIPLDQLAASDIYTMRRITPKDYGYEWH